MLQAGKYDVRAQADGASDGSALPRLALVVAMARNRVIGNEGDLPWRLPDDLKHFKAVTSGKPLLMGRKTWDSLPRKPLAGQGQHRRQPPPASAHAGCACLFRP